MTTVLHGGHTMFVEAAPRIAAAVGECELPVLTRGAMWDAWPDRFVVYNTEPLHRPRSRGPLYERMLTEAERVFDYSERNLEIYPRAEFRPMPLGEVPVPVEGDDVEVLFYGLMTPRRRVIVDALSAIVVDPAFGAVREAWIRRSRVVLCVNAYDDRNNNALRAFTALESGARLLVEETQEDWYNRECAKHAPVVPYNDLVATCKAMLSREAVAC